MAGGVEGEGLVKVVRPWLGRRVLLGKGEVSEVLSGGFLRAVLKWAVL